MTTQEKPKDATHWSTRGLAKVLGSNHSFVNRVWREVGRNPHLTVQFKVSTDPPFEAKLHDVVGLYLAPPRRLGSSVSMRSVRSKPWLARSRACRCNPGDGAR